MSQSNIFFNHVHIDKITPTWHNQFLVQWKFNDTFCSVLFIHSGHIIPYVHIKLGYVKQLAEMCNSMNILQLLEKQYSLMLLLYAALMQCISSNLNFSGNDRFGNMGCSQKFNIISNASVLNILLHPSSCFLCISQLCLTLNVKFYIFCRCYNGTVG